MAPRIAGILETCLYIADMEAGTGFYGSVLGLTPIFAEDRIVSYDLGPASVLLSCDAAGR